MMETLNTPNHVADSRKGLYAKRRSLVTSTPLILEVNDDDSERSQHRRSIIEQNKLNSSFEKSSIVSAAKALPADQLEKLLETCLRMSAENKITPRNVWQIHVIQYLDQLYNKSSSNNLQVASAGLDVSAKVYGLRVDSVYTNAIKIASDLSRQNAEENKNGDDEIDGENVRDDSEVPDECGRRKKKKTRRIKKTVIANNPKSLTAEPDVVETLDPILARLTAKNSDMNSSECLFQVILDIDEKTSELCVLSEAPYWDFRSSEDIDNTIDTEPDTEIPKMPSIADGKICAEFADFSLTDWSPEDEELRLAQRAEQETMSAQQQPNDYAFDMDSTPLPIEEPPDRVTGFDAYNSSDDEIVEGIVETQTALKRRVEQIVDMRPTFPAILSNLEYSYNTVVSGIWAGPAHWKIKVNAQKATAPASTISKESENPQRKKVKKIPKKFDFSTTEVIDVGCNKNTRLKRETIQSWLASKNTLPTDLHIEIADKLTLGLNPNIKFPISQQSGSPDLNVDENIPQYDYNNPNDSNFCVGTVVDRDPENEADGFDETLVHGDCETDGPFIGDNLISAPATVPKNFISYALKAKRMDMKKLKAAVLKVVNDSMSRSEKANDKRAVKFSEVHGSLPKLLSTEMGENLSCGLEFLALLHVANEENLELTSEDLSDFTISK